METKTPSITAGLGNSIALLLLLSLAIDALWANWTWNPIYDLLFVRIQGPFFNYAHSSSVLAVCIAAAYFILQNPRGSQPFRWVMVLFGSASIHEFSIFFWNFWKFGFVAFEPQWRDEVWYLTFLLIAITVSTPKQKEIMGVIFLYSILLMGLYVNYFHDSDLETFANPSFIYDSLIEVFGWIGLTLIWVGSYGRPKFDWRLWLSKK